MQVNIDGLKSTKDVLNKASSHLMIARGAVATIKVPDDFPSNYGSICGEIDSILASLSKSVTWIGKKITAYAEAENKNKAIIASLMSGFSGGSVSTSGGSTGGSTAFSSTGSSSFSGSNIGNSSSTKTDNTKTDNTKTDEAKSQMKDVKEALESKKLAMDNIIKNSEILSKLDKTVIEKYKEELIKEANEGKLDLANMNEKQIQFELVKRIIKGEDLNMDKTFGVLEETSGNYGVSQVALNGLDDEEVKKLEKTIAEKYNMSSEDAAKIISALKNSELDGYDTEGNLIFASFKDNPEEFEKIFGYSLYRTNSDDVISINDIGLTTDIFLTVNSSACGGTLLSISEDGKMKLNSDYLEMDGNGNYKFKEQQNLSSSEKINELMNNYAKNKSENLEYKTEMISQKMTSGSMSDEMINDIKGKIKNEITEGKNQVVLNIYQDKEHPIKFIDSETNKEYCTTAEWKENAEHSVIVTDVNDDGVVVSSWGKKYNISYDDLKNSGKFEAYSKGYQLKTEQVSSNVNNGSTTNANVGATSTVVTANANTGTVSTNSSASTNTNTSTNINSNTTASSETDTTSTIDSSAESESN